MPETIFRSPDLVRGSLPDSSGASAPTNIRWVGTTPIITLDRLRRDITWKGFGLRKKEIHNFGKDNASNAVLGVHFDAFNLEDRNDIEEQARDKKKRKKNNENYWLTN